MYQHILRERGRRPKTPGNFLGSFLYFLGRVSGLICLLLVSNAFGQSTVNTQLWQNVPQAASVTKSALQAWVQPQVFKTFSLNHSLLNPILAAAPPETRLVAPLSKTVITLPMPDGTLARFRFVESPIMAPELAARFPEIKTYVGQGIDDPAATVRFDRTFAGFHAQILSPSGAIYVDPYYQGETNFYACYYKRDYVALTKDFQCLVPENLSPGLPKKSMAKALVSGGNLRTYRLACAATAEYTQFQGGTISAGMSAIVTAINRVTGVYESELAIRLSLVANNDLLVYTNASTDPYNNADAFSLLFQNQANIDSVIGSANYDIGHVFSTAGGGMAALGVVCLDGNKAKGETGMSSPRGDAFYIDYVAHEIGHQFGANHTFNGSAAACGGGNRNSSTAYEPGSGSTIMAYAGICGPDNLQMHSDPYFHSASIDEIIAYTTSGAGSSCPLMSVTGNNEPIMSPGSNYTIPAATPFMLVANGSDPDGDGLTFCWEERDLGPSTPCNALDNGNSPLFRSFPPAAVPWRSFPRTSDLIRNTTAPGEMLPTTDRVMNFQVTARDNRAGGGGVNSADVQVSVVSTAGPFVVTSPDTAVTWSGAQTITWDVAGTTNAPINASTVNIWLSTNGGLTFTLPLAAAVPNSGSCAVVLPDLMTKAGRIKVEAVGNIFFDISNTNFSIVPENHAPVLSAISNFVLNEETLLVFTNSASDSDVPKQTLSFSLSGAPPGASIDATSGVFTWIPSRAQGPSTNQISVRVSDDGIPSLSSTQTFTVIVLPPNLSRFLRSVPAQVVVETERLILTNLTTATTDGTGQLTFSLAPDAPAGAMMNPTNGVFTWTPSEAQGPSTNVISYYVTDSVSPSVSATQSFTVIVLEKVITVVDPLAIDALTFTNNVATLQWASIPGQRYRVQFKDELNSSSWTDLTPDIIAEGSRATATDPTPPTAQRYYRLVLIP